MGWVPGPDGYPVYQEDAPAFPNPLDVLGVQTARQAIAMPPSPSEFPDIRQPTTSLAEVERDFQRLPSWAQDALETFYSPLGVVNKPFALTRQYAERAAPISAANPPLPEGAQLPSSLPSLAQMDEEFRSLPEWVQEAFKLALDPTNTLMNLPMVTSAATKGIQLAARQAPKLAKGAVEAGQIAKPIARELAAGEAGFARVPKKKLPEAAQPIPEGVVAGVAKEPWQMTREVYAGPAPLKPRQRQSSIRLTFGMKGPTPEELVQYNAVGRQIKKEEAAYSQWMTKQYEHPLLVKRALSEGKPVPPEVLADYPDLAARAAAKPIPEAIAPERPPVEPPAGAPPRGPGEPPIPPSGEPPFGTTPTIKVAPKPESILPPLSIAEARTVNPREVATRIWQKLPGLRQALGKERTAQAALPKELGQAWEFSSAAAQGGVTGYTAPFFDNFKRLFQYNPTDNTLILGSKSYDANSVFAAPSKYPLTPEQFAYIKKESSLLEGMFALEHSKGVETPRLPLEKGVEQYHPQVYVAKDGTPVEIVTTKVRRGGEPGFMKQRKLTPEQARAAGFVALSPPEAIRARMLRGYQEIINQDLRRTAITELGLRKAKPSLVSYRFEQPLFKGLSSRDAEVVRYFNSLMGAKLDPITQTVVDTSRALRGMLLAYDASWPLTMGTGALGEDIVNLISAAIGKGQRTAYFPKAMKAMWDALINPEIVVAKQAAHAEVLMPLIMRGLQYGPEAVIAEGTTILERMAGRLPGKLGEAAKGITLRAEAAFSAPALVSRIEKALVELPKTSPNELATLARSLNNMTFTYSYAGRGISKYQQAAESIMALTPSIWRAIGSMAVDLAKGKMTGRQGLKMLLGFEASTTAVYIAGSLAMGQTPQLDPTKAHYKQFKVGDLYVGLGGPLTAVERLIADVVATGLQKPDQLFALSDRQPFIKFLKGRLGVLPEAGIEVIQQKDYFGYPIETPQEWASWLIGKTTPISVGGLFEQGPETIPQRLEAVPFNVLGLRAGVESATNKRDTLQDNLAGGKWDTLTSNEQKMLERQNPQLRQLAAQAAADQAGRGSDYAERKLAQWQFEDVRDNTLTNAANALTAKRIRGEDFIKIYNDAVGTYANQTQGLWATYSGKTSTDANDLALSAYMSVPLNRNPITMEFDFDVYDAQKQAVLAGLTPEQRKYVDANQAAYPDKFPIEVAPWVRKWMNDKVLLKMYWSVADKYWGRVPGLKQVSDQIDQIPDPNQRTAMRNGMPQIRQIENMINQERLRLRLRNPALDKAVLFWTSATTPALMAR